MGLKAAVRLHEYWTWRVDGFLFPTFAEAVLAYLGKLSETVSG